MVRALLLAVGAVHVLAALAWLVVLIARDGSGPPSLARWVAARGREPRRWTPPLALLVGGSGLALVLVELTEGTGGPFSRGVVPSPSAMWLGLMAAKLLALVVAVLAGAVDGMGLEANDDVSSTWVPPDSVGTSAVVVGVVLGLVADVVGIEA